jgi:hypothetical protein
MDTERETIVHSSLNNWILFKNNTKTDTGEYVTYTLALKQTVFGGDRGSFTGKELKFNSKEFEDLKRLINH